MDDICREAGIVPSLDSPFAHTPYVYGRVLVKGLGNGARLPRINISLTDSQQPAARWSPGRSGNYCFKRSSGGGTLVVEVDGLEVARRTLPSMGSSDQREDFEITAGTGSAQSLPAVVTARFSRPPNEKTVELHKAAHQLVAARDLSGAAREYAKIVAIDDADFIAWAELGAVQMDMGDLALAETEFRRSLALRVDYTPAWLSMGKMRLAQKQTEASIEIFKHAAELEPDFARTFQLLGEAYLQNKQGTLGVDALNHAILLDPIGMADCHLRIARLYELAGAKKEAAREYKTYLEKVPDYPDRKKVEKFIKDNSN